MSKAAALQPFDIQSDGVKLITDISAFTRGRVLVVGDVMMDEYLIGDAERISPEAPVPVVRVGSERHLLGGAGNVARNITSLGGKAVLVGTRGNDAAGEKLSARLAEDGVTSALITSASRPTTIKSRILARGQQVLRFDRENTETFSAEEHEAVLAAVWEHIGTCDAVVVSDYGKGLVTEAFMRRLTVPAVNTKNVPVLVDPKPQNMHAYAGVTLLTPNAKEAGEAVRMPISNREEAEVAGKALMNLLGTEHMVITRGADGMAVFVDTNTVVHIPTTARNVFDVTGAGDTVIASMALALATGSTLVDACMLANYAAGIVVGEVGAAVTSAAVLRETVIAAFR